MRRKIAHPTIEFSNRNGHLEQVGGRGSRRAVSCAINHNRLGKSLALPTVMRFKFPGCKKSTTYRTGMMYFATPKQKKREGNVRKVLASKRLLRKVLARIDLAGGCLSEE